ncbi:DUF833-domain-containing protein [Metschnikowia bicuspidata var. bicuspidata NRRL YB-4993]|uniref:DUF833-domain-containing protein n=1 Tax=Metschnikowia bicuspidata var. bicuspidata NRRL YB-4993 TaxID=869754 RepID=A0A1A0GZ31_9ASCO|nr:DUF833-domain-containing protein [Metschnikowia bicuspidata var. bicuspidata NRRL YB-4993]OBA16957.1 DUF833-domain-containing protein [Metschnikowia bicuspidata var. bicuspidata NRRL YB-4993]
MCILITATDHPDYPFIACSNRDEFFARPTQLATVRDLHTGARILSPLDLGRDEHGTWIGVTSEGRIAILVNYKEPEFVPSKVSRGILPIDYLSSTLSDEEWYKTLDDNLTKSACTGVPVSLKDIGGFTLIYGKLEVDPVLGNLIPLNIMSNRGDRGKIHVTGPDEGGLHGKVARQKHFSVSNSLYYEPWPKVKLGEAKLAELVSTAVEKSYSRDELAEACFQILSTDTYNPTIRYSGDEFSEAKLEELCNSIFIPPLETKSATGTSPEFYGTRTQTVIMFHKSGVIHYYERDLYDSESRVQRVKNQHFVF